jgi:hypothetical protein
MRPSHASAKFLKDAPPLPKAVKKEKFVKGSMVKGRNEPATIPHVAYAIAQIKEITVEEVCEAYVLRHVHNFPQNANSIQCMEQLNQDVWSRRDCMIELSQMLK